MWRADEYSPRVWAWWESGTWKSWDLDTWKGLRRPGPELGCREGITVSSHYISSPLYTHSGLVLVLRFLPLNFWFLSPSTRKSALPSARV